VSNASSPLRRRRRILSRMEGGGLLLAEDTAGGVGPIRTEGTVVDGGDKSNLFSKFPKTDASVNLIRSWANEFFPAPNSGRVSFGCEIRMDFPSSEWFDFGLIPLEELLVYFGRRVIMRGPPDWLKGGLGSLETDKESDFGEREELLAGGLDTVEDDWRSIVVCLKAFGILILTFRNSFEGSWSNLTLDSAGPFRGSALTTI